jgi:hypothetical protein
VGFALVLGAERLLQAKRRGLSPNLDAVQRRFEASPEPSFGPEKRHENSSPNPLLFASLIPPDDTT